MNQLTQEQIKCKDDPVYFINNYVKYYDFKDGLSQFKLYEPQEKLIHKYHKNRFNIVMAPRQVGKTSMDLFYILHHIIFNDNVTDGLFSFNKKNATNSLESLITAYKNLPEWLQHKIIKWNKSTIELENGSKVIANNITYSSFKGRSFDYIMLDEFAFIPDKDAQDFMTVIFPILSARNSSKIIIASSIKQQNCYFNKIWKDSEDGKNSFVRTAIKWNEVPGWDDEWKEKMIQNIGIDRFKQEFECEFGYLK